MSNRIGRWAFELARCTRHNVMHLRRFKVSHHDGVWRVRGEGCDMRFPYYPYLAFHDIEGYLGDRHFMPQPGMTVLDAGGCFGEFSLFASQRVGMRGRVLMLEPDPANIEVATRLFAMNGSPKNIEIVPAGLWSAPGRLRFAAGKDAQSAVVTSENTANDIVAIEVEVHSLSSLVQTFDLKRLDLVKMDIEGAELEALVGARDLPPELRPSYAIASYHVVNGRKTADAMPALFESLGYETRTANPRHLTTWAWPVR